MAQKTFGAQSGGLFLTGINPPLDTSATIRLLPRPWPSRFLRVFPSPSYPHTSRHLCSGLALAILAGRHSTSHTALGPE